MRRYSRLRGFEFGESNFELLSIELPKTRTQCLVEEHNQSDTGKLTSEHVQGMSNGHDISSSNKIMSSSSMSTRGSSQNPPQQHLVPGQNIENGNPNLTPSGIRAVDDSVCVQRHTGAYLREQVDGGGFGSTKLGESPSDGWIMKSTEGRSGSREATGADFFGTDDGSSPTAHAAELMASQRAASVQRVASYLHQQPSSQETYARRVPASKTDRVVEEDELCASHSTCHCVNHSLPSTSGLGLMKEFQRKGASSIAVGKRAQKSLSSVTVVRDGSVSDREFGGYPDRRSRAAMPRSSSTKDGNRRRSNFTSMDLDSRKNDRPNSDSRSQSSCGIRHRVSFSVIEDSLSLERQASQEKWKGPAVPHSRILAEKNPIDQLMRYNYEQPGFVEREKDAGAGRAYTIYGVNGIDCSTSSSASCQSPLSRAFSLREKGSTYSRISRSFSTGKHSLPLECVTCGKRLGTVVHAFPGQNDAGVCKSCKLYVGAWSIVDHPTKKKHSILEYCRKLFGLSKKARP